MHTESGLTFDFAAAVSSELFDTMGRPQPDGWKRVDFIVEQVGEVLLVEVKNPEQPGARPYDKAAFLRQMSTFELIPELVRKLRDTYCFQHLMERDEKPFVAVVLLGVSLDDAQLLDFQIRLGGRLAQETDAPWKRQYVKGCVVLSPEKWKLRFPEYPLTVV